MYFKWRAKRVMGERGNLTRLIAASLVLIMLSDAFVYLYETIASALCGELTRFLIFAEIFLLVLFALPLYYSLMRIAYLMAEGKQTRLSDILWGYDSPERLRKLYMLFISRALKAAAVGAASVLLAYACVFWAFEKTEISFSLACVLAFLFMTALSGLFPTAFVLPELLFSAENGKAEISTASHGRVRRYAAEISLFNLSFVPLLALSALTLGILLFVFLIPYYLLCRAAFVSYLISLD